MPIFVGFLIWVGICTAGLGLVFLFVRSLRPFAGFVFLTPLFGATCAFAGFLAVGWFFDKRLRPEVAMSLAFYFGFLLCGAIGSAVGLICGFLIWRRARR